VTGGYVIRPFESTEEYHDCVALQEETWGIGFSERVSPAILKVAQILGGVSAGAYDATGRLVGFVFGLTGVRDGEVVHWSDMLAVRPEARDSGLGGKLKAYQRDEVMARGVDKMFWTFDPLQARNAHLNVNKLGAVVREYAENMYGDTDSPLHRGIGTDRFVALWLMASARVKDALAGVAPPAGDSGARALAYVAGGAHPTPGEPEVGHDGAPVIRVAVPSDLGSLMDDDLPLAVAWRLATRPVFRHYLSVGYEVAGFERGAPTSDYLLRPAIDHGP